RSDHGAGLVEAGRGAAGGVVAHHVDRLTGRRIEVGAHDPLAEPGVRGVPAPVLETADHDRRILARQLPDLAVVRRDREIHVPAEAGPVRELRAYGRFVPGIEDLARVHPLRPTEPGGRRYAPGED